MIWAEGAWAEGAWADGAWGPGGGGESVYLEEAIVYLRNHLLPYYISQSEYSSGPKLNADLHRHVLVTYGMLLAAQDGLTNGD